MEGWLVGLIVLLVIMAIAIVICVVVTLIARRNKELPRTRSPVFAQTAESKSTVLQMLPVSLPLGLGVPVSIPKAVETPVPSPRRDGQTIDLTAPAIYIAPAIEPPEKDEPPDRSPTIGVPQRVFDLPPAGTQSSDSSVISFMESVAGSQATTAGSAVSPPSSKDTSGSAKSSVTSFQSSYNSELTKASASAASKSSANSVPENQDGQVEAEVGEEETEGLPAMSDTPPPSSPDAQDAAAETQADPDQEERLVSPEEAEHGEGHGNTGSDESPDCEFCLMEGRESQKSD